MSSNLGFGENTVYSVNIQNQQNFTDTNRNDTFSIERRKYPEEDELVYKHNDTELMVIGVTETSIENDLIVNNVEFNGTITGLSSIQSSDGNTKIETENVDGAILFNTDGSEKARLNGNGNLGID